MGIIKDQIQEQIKIQMRDQVAKKQKEKFPEEKTVGGLFANLGRNITDLSKGIVGLGYKAVRHPVESGKSVFAAGLELGKQVPRAAKELGGQMVETVAHPIKTTKELVSSYKDLRAVPFEKQKEFFTEATKNFIDEDERGKRVLGILGSGLLGATTQEISHPAQYAYENPLNFALDILTAGQVSGANKLVSGAAKTAASKIPAVAKVQSAMKEVFLPNGKLVASGFDDLSTQLTKAKSEMFKVQKQVVEDTANKFYKEFKLNPKEQTEFFDTIDTLRRTPVGEGGVAPKAASANPKIQQAINWWLDQEAPKLAEQAGLPAEKAIQNYMHHFFPEKFKAKETAMTKPLQYSKKGYLKESKDVEGFTKDPVLSISAIKSKVAVDNIRDSFIKNTIDQYAVKTDSLVQQLTDAGIDVSRLDKNGMIETAKKVLGLEEYKPKGNLRFFPVTTQEGNKLAAVSTNVETHLLPKVIVEELNKFTTGNKSTIEKLFLPFDVFNRNWKPLATAVRPRYHARNILGNIYNSTVVAGNNPISFILKDMPEMAYKQIKNTISTEIKNNSLSGKIYQKLFGNVVEPDLIKLAVDNDVVGRGFFGADINDLTTAYNKGEDIMKTIKNINTPAEIYKVPVLKQWLQISSKVGSFLEDNARLALFKKGLKKFPGDVDQAKTYVNNHLFDYLTGLGEGDKFIKRFIPFWSWTRFNIPLQAGSLLKAPLRYAAIEKATEPSVKESEISDEGFQYLTPEQKAAGLMKVGVAEKGDKEYDKYIKTASVLPLDDLSRLTDILQGKDEEIGITPLKQIVDLIRKDPTKFKTYFGQPVESFKGEEKKFLGGAVRGKTKELLSTLPFLTEINKLLGGGYAEEDKPKMIDRVEQVLSPLGVSLVDRESNKFFYELEKQKELSGSYTSGLQQIYKKYLKIDLERKGTEKYASDNIKILEKMLKQKGLNELDLLKIKNSAVKAVLQDAFKVSK